MKLHDKTFLMMTIVFCGTVAVSVVQDADAHITFNIPAPNTLTNYQNKTIVFTVGETNEPAYSDEIHNFELTLRDYNTRHTIPNAFRNYTAGNAQSLWVDAYFVPKGTTGLALSGSDCANAAKFKRNTADSSYNCVLTGTPPAGKSIVASKDQPIRQIFGKAGVYQAKDQWYSEAGHTVYHIYGQVNYFSDAMIRVNVWADGKTIKQATNGALVSHIVPTSGGFGLHDRTDEFWPPSTTQPENMRQAAVVNWNFLDSLRQALVNVVNFVDFSPPTLR